MPGIETLVVILIVALALVLTVWKLHRMFSGKSGSCICDGSCPLKDQEESNT
jgi:hypothetical protein